MLVLSADSFLSKSAKTENAKQQNFKLVIKSVNLIIHIKHLTSTAQNTHMDQFQTQNMRRNFLRVKIKHLSIFSNHTSINYDTVLICALMNYVIDNLFSDADNAGGYQKMPFNFLNFGLNRIELKRNGMSLPREGLTSYFADRQYKKFYIMFRQE